jgi:hypothetical protein
MSQVLELAQQGDTEAISALMNRHLKPQGVTAQVAKSQNALQIMLEGLDVPDQTRMTAFVTQGIQKLGLGSNVQIFGRQVGEKPAWSANFAISDSGITPMDSAAALSTEGTEEFGAGDFKRMAKQGNPGAIQKFVDEILSDRPEMTGFAEYADGTVKVIIQTSEFMDGQAFSSEFGNRMNEIASKQVREVELYKRKSEKTPPFLVKKMTLAASGGVSAAPTPVHNEGKSEGKGELRPNGHSSAMNPPPMATGPVGKGSMARPGEVTTIAILLFIAAGFSIALGIMSVIGVMAMSAVMAQAGAEAGITRQQAGAVAGVGAVVMLLACLPILMGAGQISVGVGVLKMKKWAWYGAFAFAVLAILTSVLDLLRLNIFAFFRVSLNIGVIKSLINNSEAFEN